MAGDTHFICESCNKQQVGKPIIAESGIHKDKYYTICRNCIGNFLDPTQRWGTFAGWVKTEGGDIISTWGSPAYFPGGDQVVIITIAEEITGQMRAEIERARIIEPQFSKTQTVGKYKGNMVVIYGPDQDGQYMVEGLTGEPIDSHYVGGRGYEPIDHFWTGSLEAITDKVTFDGNNALWITLIDAIEDGLTDGSPLFDKALKDFEAFLTTNPQGSKPQGLDQATA